MRRSIVAAVTLVTCACGVLGGSAAPTATPAPTVAPTAALTATRAPAPATATPAAQPTSTPEATSFETVWVANTDGQGVYLRRTPAMADRLRAYPDRTELSIIG